MPNDVFNIIKNLDISGKVSKNGLVANIWNALVSTHNADKVFSMSLNSNSDRSVDEAKFRQEFMDDFNSGPNYIIQIEKLEKINTDSEVQAYVIEGTRKLKKDPNNIGETAIYRSHLLKSDKLARIEVQSNNLPNPMLSFEEFKKMVSSIKFE
jgi:hypothetical protein